VWRAAELRRLVLGNPQARDSPFGSPLKLSRVYLVWPQVVVEVTYLTWTEENLLRQSYQGQREDKPAIQVVRPIPHPRAVAHATLVVLWERKCVHHATRHLGRTNGSSRS
jgi:hypothetical protein